MLFVAAALAIAIGFGVLGVMTAPDPEAIEALNSTTTSTSTTSTTIAEIEPPLDLDNFTVGQITTGEQFVWERVRGFADWFPHSLIEHDGHLYVFGTNGSPWSDDPGVLRGWRSPNGIDWEPLGTVVDGQIGLGLMASTPQGLVAFEIDQGDRVGIWQSSDGLAWSRSEIVVADEEGEPLTIWPMAIGGTSDLLMVATETQLDVQRIIEERMGENGFDVDLLSNYGWTPDWTADGLQIVLHGPLGLVGMAISGDELRLTDQEESLVANGYGGSAQTRLWVTSDGSKWVDRPVEASAWIQSIVPAPDGGVLAFGYGSSGDSAWYSPDGTEWTPRPRTGGPQTATAWRDGLVGVNSDGSRPEVLTSDDGATWEETHLDEHFPLPIGWYSWGLAAGDAGVALMVNGWRHTAAPSPPREDVELTRDGVTLALDMNSGAIMIESGDVVHSWTMWSSTEQDGIEVDLESQTVTFHDTTSGDPLTSFTFEELNNAEMEYWNAQSGGDTEHRVFAFTPDGENWTIQDMELAVGLDRPVQQLAVIGDRVVALVQNSGFIGQPSEAGFEIWAAEIP